MIFLKLQKVQDVYKALKYFSMIFKRLLECLEVLNDFSEVVYLSKVSKIPDVSEILALELQLLKDKINMKKVEKEKEMSLPGFEPGTPCT